MNLIGHYACAAVPRAEVRAGAVLPDLAGLYRRRVRSIALAKHWRAAAPLEDALAAVLAGVDFHHAVDVTFHRSDLFRDTAGALQRALLEASRAPGLKRFLPAHVLCELYLDHLLLGRNGELGEAFYADVRATGDALAAFVAAHPEADAPSFSAFLEHITEDRFVDAYHTHEGILTRMNRILVRFGQRPLGAAEQEAVSRCFSERAGRTEAMLDAFLEAVEQTAPRRVAGADGSMGWAPPGPQPGRRTAQARGV